MLLELGKSYLIWTKQQMLQMDGRKPFADGISINAISLWRFPGFSLMLSFSTVQDESDLFIYYYFLS